MLVISCTNITVDIPDGESTESAHSGKYYSIDEAKSMVYQWMDILEGPGTRSGKAREITGTEVITGAVVPTRSSYYGVSSSDTLLYVFNFGDNDGYSVVSPIIHDKDSNLSGNNILCITESGNMSGILSVAAAMDEDYDPYMSPFDDSDDEYLDDDPYDGDALDGEEDGSGFITALLIQSGIMPVKAEDPKQPIDPNNPGGYAPGGGDGSYTGGNGSGWTNWSQIGGIDPLLETKWDQKSPYRDMVQGNIFYGDNRYPAGCVAIAMCQICAYYEYPKTFWGQTLDWSQMKTVGVFNNGRINMGTSEAQKSVATFIANTGLCAGLNYSKSGTSGSARKAKFAFKEMGYKNLKKYLGYKDGKILNMLKDGRPVFLTAVRKETIFKWSGHAWVLDGYREFQRFKISNVTTTQKNELGTL